MGDSMAQLRAQPREMHSLAFSVRDGSACSVSFRMASTAGTRELPPTISTLASWSGCSLASANACVCNEPTHVAGWHRCGIRETAALGALASKQGSKAGAEMAEPQDSQEC